MRLDLEIIDKLIPENTTVMDLGCGTGKLLAILKKKCSDYQGIEKDKEKAALCIKKGLRVYNLDFNQCLAELNDNSFDYLILNDSFQETQYPVKVIEEALRIGKNVIIGFPNFAYYKARFQLFFRGKTPVTGSLPHEWYKTPNLRFLTIADFNSFCRDMGIEILQKKFTSKKKYIKFFPNLFASKAIYLLRKR